MEEEPADGVATKGSEAERTRDRRAQTEKEQDEEQHIEHEQTVQPVRPLARDQRRNVSTMYILKMSESKMNRR